MGKSDIAEQNSQLSDNNLQSQPLAKIIGQAVKHCAKAQNKALDSMLQYIEESSFTTVDGHREVAMLSFVFELDGKKNTIRMPLISVVPAQFVQINDVEINFNVDISNNQKKYAVRIAPSRSAIKRVGTSSYDLQRNINVNIRAANIDMSGGMARLLQLASTNGIRIKPVDEK